MLKIRRSHDRLIFIMGIPIPGKDGFYIETGPCLPWVPPWCGLLLCPVVPLPASAHREPISANTDPWGTPSTSCSKCKGGIHHLSDMGWSLDHNCRLPHHREPWDWRKGLVQNPKYGKTCKHQVPYSVTWSFEFWCKTLELCLSCIKSSMYR